MKQLIDRFGRVHDYLRFSLTDKCNLNCFYCNPKDGKKKALKHKSLLTIDEITRLVQLFVKNHGIKKVRFTGGEPLLRRDLPGLFNNLYRFKQENPFQTAITSNGTTLHRYLNELRALGLDKVNISLDTLNRDKYRKITGYDMFDDVIKSIDMAEGLGFKPVKINTVIIKGINDDEIYDFVDFVKDRDLNVRFIEFMPFAGNNWSETGLLTYREMKRMIGQRYGLKLINSEGNSVAKDYEINGYSGKVSFISSISDHFCRSCNRLRISSDGKMKLCLFTNGSPSLNFIDSIRNSQLSDADISNMIEGALQFKKEKHRPAGEILSYKNNKMLSLGG